MTNATDRRKRQVPTSDVEKGAEDFLHRWSRRKHQARKRAEEIPRTIPAATPEPTAPAKVLTDADMPPIESLDENSDYSPFMSPGVSEELRRKALRKLFTLPGISERDPLDGEYYDCHGYEPLGDVVTHEMREEMEREAQRAKEQETKRALLEEKKTMAATGVAGKSSDIVPSTEPAPGPTKDSGKTDAELGRHSRHLRKRAERKRSHA